MIVMKPEILHDQSGMEQAMETYLQDVRVQCSGTLNAMLDLSFVSCDYDKKTVTFSAQPQPWMANPGGILHGGITAAYLDIVMGVLCRYCSGGYMPVSIHMDVNYLRAVSLESNLMIHAKITRVGSSICVAEGSIWDASNQDRLLATSGGTYSVIKGTA